MNKWSEFFVLLGIGILLLIGASKLRIEEGELPESFVETESYENFDEEPNPEEEILREYNVIVGSFTEEQNAQEFIEEIKDFGYNGKILVSEDFLYRVSIFSSDVRKDCSQFKSENQVDLKMWILYEPLGVD
jgi:hypothetical protein